MGNNESGEFGNMDVNEETNWFNNDGDSFTSRRTSRSRSRNKPDSDKYASHTSVKESKNHRSYSAIVDRAQTPVSMVSPLMKNNYQLRSHSARKATTPVSEVVPFMLPPTLNKTYNKHNSLNKNYSQSSAPFVKTTPQDPNQLNAFYHSSFQNKNPTVIITNITKNASNPTKRSSSIAKTNYVQPENTYTHLKATSKRSHSTPRNIPNQQVTQASQIHQLNYNTPYPNYTTPYISSVPSKQPQQQSQQKQPTQQQYQPHAKPVATPVTTPVVRDRSAHQQTPSNALNRTYIKRSENKSLSSEKTPNHQVTVAPYYPPQPQSQQQPAHKLAPPQPKPVSSAQTTNKITLVSKRSIPDPHTYPAHREFKYPPMMSNTHSNPIHYNQQYGNMLKTQSPVARSMPSHQYQSPRLMNDLEALQHIDLDAMGLSEYKHFVKNILPKYSNAINPVKYYKNNNNINHVPVVSNVNGRMESQKVAVPKRASSQSHRPHVRNQLANQQNYMNYYQNPQFITSGTSMAVQTKLNNYPKYEHNFNSVPVINGNKVFNSVYLSGY